MSCGWRLVRLHSGKWRITSWWANKVLRWVPRVGSPGEAILCTTQEHQDVWINMILVEHLQYSFRPDPLHQAFHPSLLDFLFWTTNSDVGELKLSHQRWDYAVLMSRASALIQRETPTHEPRNMIESLWSSSCGALCARCIFLCADAHTVSCTGWIR